MATRFTHVNFTPSTCVQFGTIIPQLGRGMALSQGKMTTEPKVPFQQQPSLSASACLTPGGGESLCCLLSMNKLKPLPLVYVNTFSLISCRRSHPLCLLALILKWRTEPNREKQRGYWKINTLNLCEALPLSILFDVLGVPKEKAIPLTVPGLLPLFGGREPKTHPRR